MRSRPLASRLGWFTITLGTAMFAAAGASALPGQGFETALRYATEPSTGSMVLTALVVIAAVRRGKS